MALDYTVEYSGQVATGDAGYPYGKPQNESVEGDGIGTPWEAALVKDLFGFLQAVLLGGRTVPSGTPDSATTSQYLAALKKLLQPLAVFSWDQPLFLQQNLLPVDPAEGIRVAVSPNINDLATDKLVASGDGGNTWGALTLTGTGVIFLCCASDGGTKYVASGSKGGGTDVQHNATLSSLASLGAWSATTLPGTPTEIHCALYEPSTARFILTGKTASAPYIATCEAADLTTWTQRTVPGSITGSKNSLSLVRIGSTVVASWADQTKVAYSTDGGLTWTASTTSLASGKHTVVAGETKFVSLSRDSAKVYNSTDGITWTAQPDLARPELDFERWAFKFLGGVYIFRCSASDFYFFSLDNGATWTRVYDVNRTWSNFAIVRNRLLQFRYLPNGSDIDVWMERSLPIAMPVAS
jgi:hypothetical protein